MSEQVVKAKNEGRVAAGKRLVEWNRRNKEDLLKNKNQVNQVHLQVLKNLQVLPQTRLYTVE